MFDYKLIEAYAAVIREGSFNNAARQLHITQSAVSQRVKQLEEYFGRIVLLRTTPPQSTDFGSKVLRLYNQVNRLEDDLLSSSYSRDTSLFTSLPVAINADSLSTWFLKAVQPFLSDNEVVLDLMVDDQDQTHRFLRDGKVLGCISTRKKALQGCRVTFLGDIEYGLFCSSGFAKRWFPNGMELGAVKRAPMITFNRKDELNTNMLKGVFGRLPQKFATFYVPSAETFLQFIRAGLAYGALPDQQSSGPLQRGEIVELAPDHRVKVSLYWHCWNIDSELLQRFSDQIVKGFATMVG